MNRFRSPVAHAARILITAATVVATSAAVVGSSAGVAHAALAAPAAITPTILQFTNTAAPTDWVVPPLTTRIQVHAVGGAGGSGTGTPHGVGGSGGFGGVVDIDLPVVPGEALTVWPGAMGLLSGPGISSVRGGYAGIDDVDGAAGYGNGGAASLVFLGATTLVSAGGGGGGGGASDNGLYPGDGGDGGNGGGFRGYAGHAAHSGSGGVGHVGSQNGGDGGDAAYFSYAGGGGGGGAGWLPEGSGGGAGGGAGSSTSFDGGAGGGGAGGASYSIEAGAATSSATERADGVITITYTPYYTTVGNITSAANPSIVGTPVRITAHLSWSSSTPAPTGSIVFGRVDPNSHLETDTEYWDASVNSSPTSFPTVYAVGDETLYAYYTGDTYHSPWKAYYTQHIVAAVVGLTANPTTLAFGARPLHTTALRTVTLTNRGNVSITLTSVAFTRPDYRVGPGGSCSQYPLLPGASCTYAVTFSPISNTQDNAILTVNTDRGVKASVSLTGRGLVAPTVTAISPKSGLLAGGTVVTVTGTSLQSVSAIKFGAVAGTNLTCPTATKCTVKAPRGAVRGIVNVRVTNAAGTSAIVTADRYTYV